MKDCFAVLSYTRQVFVKNGVNFAAYMLLRNKPYERDAFCKTHPMKEVFLSNQAA